MLKLSHDQIKEIGASSLNGVTEFGEIKGLSGVKLENDGSIADVTPTIDAVTKISAETSAMVEKFFKGNVLNNINSLTVKSGSLSDVKYENDKNGNLTGSYTSFGMTNSAVANVLDHIKSNFKLESYDGQALRNAQAISLVTNLSFSRPTTFEMVLFPRLHLEGENTTLDFIKKVPIMFNNFNRAADKIQTNFRDDYYSIPLAMWTEDLIKSNSIRIMHILQPVGNAQVASDREKHLLKDLAREATFKNTAVKVAPISIKIEGTNDYNKVDVINLSSLDYSLTERRTDRDTLNNQISVKNFFVKITAGGQSVFYKLDATNKIGNMFSPVAENSDHQLRMANAIKFPVTLSELKAYNPQTNKNDADPHADFKAAVSTLNAQSVIQVVPNLHIDFAGGMLSVESASSYFVDSDQAVAAAVQVELVGFEIDSTLANLNLREIGQLLGFVELKFGYQIEYKDPVSVQGTIADLGKGNNDDFNNAIDLGTMVNAQSAVHAVKTFLSHFEYLSSSALTAINNKVLNPVERTVAVAYLKPYVCSVAHDVSTTNSLNSTSLLEDIKSNIMNRIIVEADKMYTSSKYNNAFAVTVGQNQRPCVAIVTSNNVAKYLGVTGDGEGSFQAKELTPNLDYIIVTVPANDEDMNKEFYESIFLTFVDPRSISNGTTTDVCPVSFGFTLYKNMMTLEFQRSAQESVKYLTAFPCYRHIAQLPIMVKLNVTGLPTIMSSKVSLLVSNSMFANQGGQVTII